MRTLITAGGVALAGTALGTLAYTAVMNVGTAPAAATNTGSQAPSAAATCAAPGRVVGGVCETVVHKTAPSSSNGAVGPVAVGTGSAQRTEVEDPSDDSTPSASPAPHDDADDEDATHAGDHNDDATHDDEPKDD